MVLNTGGRFIPARKRISGPFRRCRRRSVCSNGHLLSINRGSSPVLICNQAGAADPVCIYGHIGIRHPILAFWIPVSPGRSRIPAIKGIVLSVRIVPSVSQNRVIRSSIYYGFRFFAIPIKGPSICIKGQFIAVYFIQRSYICVVPYC